MIQKNWKEDFKSLYKERGQQRYDNKATGTVEDARRINHKASIYLYGQDRKNHKKMEQIV
jgi:hypothetical protein